MLPSILEQCLVEILPPESLIYVPQLVGKVLISRAAPQDFSLVLLGKVDNILPPSTFQERFGLRNEGRWEQRVDGVLGYKNDVRTRKYGRSKG